MAIFHHFKKLKNDKKKKGMLHVMALPYHVCDVENGKRK
jgi:hypothetical protein